MSNFEKWVSWVRISVGISIKTSLCMSPAYIIRFCEVSRKREHHHHDGCLKSSDVGKSLLAQDVTQGLEIRITLSSTGIRSIAS